jgi:hypothetical protein
MLNFLRLDLIGGKMLEKLEEEPQCLAQLRRNLDRYFEKERRIGLKEGGSCARDEGQD